MSTAVKRACDACHRRKVKCDGINPCRNCSSAQLTCTYNAIPQKKGPKGSRAKVISELRETQRATSLSAKVQNRLNGINSPPCTPALQPNSGLLSSDLMKESIDFFFANMYPIMPILNRQRLEQQTLYLDQSLDTYCMLTSMAAFMLLQPGMTMPGGDPLFEHPGASITSSHLLMEETMRVRKGFDYTQSPTLNTLCTSYFLFGCYYALDMHEKAWYHLREATTLIHMCGMTQEEKYLQFDSVESSRRRRLYWLLFVTERAYSVKFGRPMSLPNNINLPTLTDDPTDPLGHQLNSFIMLVNLFKPFDDTFMFLWNKTRNECSAPYLGALQKQLAEMNPYMNGAEGDMRTNQQWLKAVTWHLSTQNGCVPQNSTDPSPYQYPLDMSRDLMSITSQFSTQSTELLGVPLVAKLLEISCSLADVLALQPSSGDPFSIGPQQQLQSLLQVVSVLRSGQHHFLPLLLSQVHDVLPRLANPMLQRAPDNLCNVDIFDGFGNAGMAQPPVMTDYKTESYTPAPVSRMDDVATDSGSSNGAPTSADMNSPFPMVSSPPVMSPGVQYPTSQANSMNDYSSMRGMVITSMGQESQPTISQAGPMTTPQPQQQHQSYQPNPSMHSQMQNGMHNQINPTSSQPMTGMNHQQSPGHNQGYNQINQSMLNNMMQHRQPPPRRQNSFVVHPQQQQQMARTVADYNTLQRQGSENVTMNNLGIGALGAEIDFSALR